MTNFGKDDALMIEWSRAFGLVLEPAVSFSDVRAKLDRMEREMAKLERQSWPNAANYLLVMRAAMRGGGVSVS